VNKLQRLCLAELLLRVEVNHKLSNDYVTRGIANPGNSCYINATLQCLLAMPAFYNMLNSCKGLLKPQLLDGLRMPMLKML
jgi:ubiquitin C-terminal hydrolase